MPNSLSLSDKLKAAQKAGFDAVEISIDETDEKLERLKMPISGRKEIASFRADGIGFDSMCLSGQRKYPMGSNDPDTLKRSLEIINDAIHFAYDTGIRIIQLAGYDVYYEGASTPDTKKRFTENLAKATETAASYGVVLGIETMENDFLNTVGKGMEFVNTVGSPYLNMYPDIGNVRNATPDVIGDLASGKGHICAVHIKETVENVFRNMHYGEGRVEFAEILPFCQSLGVTFFNAEFWYDEKTDYMDELNKASRFLRNILKP